MNCNLPGSYVHGIFWARVLEWVAISYSRRIFPTQGSNQCFLSLLHWQAVSLPLGHLGNLVIGAYKFSSKHSLRACHANGELCLFGFIVLCQMLLFYARESTVCIPVSRHLTYQCIFLSSPSASKLLNGKGYYMCVCVCMCAKTQYYSIWTGNPILKSISYVILLFFKLAYSTILHTHTHTHTHAPYHISLILCFSVLLTLLVLLKSSNEIPQAGWLIKNTVLFLAALEVGDQGAIIVGIRLSSRLQNSCVLMWWKRTGVSLEPLL